MLLFWAGSLPGQSPLEDLQAHLHTTVPEVRALLALEILDQTKDARVKQDMRDLLETVAPQLDMAYPVNLLRGYATDRPTGFRSNAARLRITQSDVYSVLALEYSSAANSPDLNRAEDFLGRAHRLLNQSIPCAVPHTLFAGEFPRALAAFWRAAAKQEPKARDAAHAFARNLLQRSTQSALDLALAKMLAELELPLDEWVRQFAEKEDTNRSFVDMWVFGYLKGNFEPFEKQGKLKELLIALDARLRKQLAKPLCSDHYRDGQAELKYLEQVREALAKFEIPTEPYRASDAEPEPREIEPTYQSTPQASEMFELGRQMRHTPRLKPEATPEERLSALQDAVAHAKTIAAWPGDPSFPSHYPPIQRLYFTNALLYSLPPVEEYRFPILDLQIGFVRDAFSLRANAPIAVYFTLEMIERFAGKPETSHLLLEKLAQAGDPNLQALVAYTLVKKAAAGPKPAVLR
ncbi:MAG: hypothetical protein NW208_06745 [Bryobacter sp.]|nr:hypothetical protein [Bryobacter sp.]